MGTTHSSYRRASISELAYKLILLEHPMHVMLLEQMHINVSYTAKKTIKYYTMIISLRFSNSGKKIGVDQFLS